MSMKFHSSSKSIRAVETEPWWASEGAIRFDCTGCGKCCVNDGEVWMDTEELVELAESLQLTVLETIDRYVEQVQDGWVKLLNSKPHGVAKEEEEGLDRCIFLGADGKRCSIYKQRPAQCRTYPYWPRLLASPQAWKNEAVVPADSTLTGRKWHQSTGGCEGIGGPDVPIVNPEHIYRNNQLYDAYLDAFPFTSSGDDRGRLLAKAEIMNGVTTSTRAWVKQFVIDYGLCPFAEAVFQAGSVRYRVFLGTDRSLLISKVRYEILHLLTTPEEEASTTLLMTPFMFSAFEDFYEFALDLEDKLIPDIEVEANGPCDGGGSNGEVDIQLASFHPLFQWGGTEMDDPLNYEKRAPFPTFNLLRAQRVREYADEARTGRIADGNVQSLEGAGAETLKREFQAIVQLALE